MTATIQKTNSLGGVSFGQQTSIAPVSEIPTGHNATIPAAKAGTLTTRTDDNTGVITLTANGGVAIISTDVVDVYWAGGSRRSMVATVAALALSIEGGVGDVLPADETAVTVMTQQEREIRFDGDNLQVLLGTGEAKCTIILTGDDDVEDFSILLPNANQVYDWYTGNGVTNPVAGDTITKCYVTHGDSTAARKVKTGVGIS